MSAILQTTVKLTGSAVVSLSAVIWGQKRLREERRKTAVLAEMCSLVGFIGERIKVFAPPLCEIYADFSSDVLSGCGFLPVLRTHGMKAAVESMSDLIDADVRETLIRFAQSLGGEDREEQLSLCEVTEERLGKLLDARKTTENERKKLYGVCPLLGALALILMFI